VDSRRDREVVVNGQHLKEIGTFEIDTPRYNELQSRIKSYPHDLAVYAVNSAAVWAFPLIAIYLLGMGVAWIRAGFRKTA
jgi:hypothetical protein